MTWQGPAFPAKDFTGPPHDFIGEPHEVFSFAGPRQEQTQRGHGRGRAPPPRLGDTDAGGAARWAGEGMGTGPPQDHMQRGVGVGTPLAPPAGARGHLGSYAQVSSPLPRTDRTSLVPPLVLTGQVSSGLVGARRGDARRGGGRQRGRRRRRVAGRAGRVWRGRGG